MLVTMLTATDIPAGTRIVALIDNKYVRLSQKATGMGSGLSWNIASDTQSVFQSGIGVIRNE